MSLMTLVRLFSALLLAWTVVALGIGTMGGQLPSRPALASFHVESTGHGTLTQRIPGSERSQLVDLVTGRAMPLVVPKEGNWANVNVALWRDERGDVEVTGRWVNYGDGEFCGMGSFRLSDGAVVSRVALDILPTGPACCVPGEPRTILFPAGDGRLYRCRLPLGESLVGIDNAPAVSEGHASLLPIIWRGPTPGGGAVSLNNPMWSPDPRFRKWLVVSLSQQIQQEGRLQYKPSELWWLEMDEHAESIVASGRLTLPSRSEEAGSHPYEQYANIAVGPNGEVQLVYLTRERGQQAAELRSAKVQFDAVSGRPFVAPGRDGNRIVSDGLSIGPLLVSADGTKVHGLDQSGRVITYSLASKSD